MRPASVPSSGDSRLRPARPEDAAAIAGLHADSSRRHYRGAYADAFLDTDDVTGFLLTLWTGRLAAPPPQARTIVAELDGELAGFAHVLLRESATGGALLDNLHVRFARKRNGTGTRLLAQAGRAVAGAAPGSGLYLWVARPGCRLGADRLHTVTKTVLTGVTGGTPEAWAALRRLGLARTGQRASCRIPTWTTGAPNSLRSSRTSSARR